MSTVVGYHRAWVMSGPCVHWRVLGSYVSVWRTPIGSCFFPVVKSWFNIAPPTPGDPFTVNVGSYVLRDEERPFANKHAASLRAIYDLADLERSRFMQSTGQSGNVFSPWYASLAERWAHVQYIEIPTARAKIGAVHTLRLNPR